ncbi:unnamed protein product [Meganyctiphanes norvegica]|uniref:XK-related protein n=1 Tax=Meganyctiphanes norvegica TaxID=48144 RepID=A0AAV2R868_MEGNR
MACCYILNYLPALLLLVLVLVSLCMCCGWFSFIKRKCCTCVDALKAKYEQHKAKFGILGKVIGIILYILDITTDTIASVQHYLSGHPRWGGCTAAFIAMPLVLGNSWVIYWVIKGIGEFAEMSLCGRVLLVGGGIVCPPLLPLGYLVAALDTAVRKYPDIPTIDDSDTTESAALLKLFEAVLEALPQASFQLFVVGQGLVGIGDTPGTWQYLAIATSLVSLAWSMANNDVLLGYLGIDDISGRGTVFTSVLVITASRLLVASTFSMYSKYLFWGPISFELAACIFAIIAGRCHVGHWFGFFDLPKKVWMGIFLIGTLINIGCGISGIFLPVPQPFAITALSVAAVTAIIAGIFLWYIFKESTEGNTTDGDIPLETFAGPSNQV